MTTVADREMLATQIYRECVNRAYPEAEVTFNHSRCVELLAVCANEARLEEAERMYANWNVDESIRRFDVWARNHIAELRALKAEGLK